MPLTTKEVKNAKPGRHSDGKGLYLLVKPTAEWARIKEKHSDGEAITEAERRLLLAKPPGPKSWVLRVQHGADRRDFGLGSVVLDPVPVDLPIECRKLLTLAEARKKAEIGRALAKAGINPSERWRQSGQPVEAPRTFRQVSEECHGQATKGWRNEKHRVEWLASLERYAFPTLGDKPVESVDAAAIQKVLQQDDRDDKKQSFWMAKSETARRVKQRIGAVLDYAHAKGFRPTEAPMRAVNQLMRGVRQPKAGNFAAMPYKDVPAFMATVRDGGLSSGRLALRFLILTAARPGEVRFMQWKDIDLEAAEWRVPAEKAKADKLHIVPLVPAALDILTQAAGLYPAKPNGYVFPGLKGKPMSDATMAKVQRAANGGAFTVHAHRSAFRDWAADNGFADSWCEAALAHLNPNKTEAAYRRTTFFEQRRDRLMPAWAAFALNDQSNVVSLAASRA